MNEESTIADYLTDCGIQVVTVVDENTNNPIVACWVYVVKIIMVNLKWLLII